MMWKSVNEYYEVSDTGLVRRKAYLRVGLKQGKKIKGYNDKEIIVFNSANEAGRYLNKTPSNIITCANGHLQTAYGYKWAWEV